MNLDEVPLTGGEMTPGIVRIGDTVRRPVKVGAPFRHKFLQLLEIQGCGCAPKFLGIDAQDREILSFVDGEVLRDGSEYSRVALAMVGAMLREIHDASAGSDLAGEREVVVHNDIAPWNTVSAGGRPVGFIDFDGAEPGSRLNDIAYMVWTFLDIGSNQDQHQLRLRLEAMLSGYGLESRLGLASAITHQQRRVLEWRSRLAASAGDELVRAKSIERVDLIQGQILWVEQHASMIDQE